MTTNFKPNQWNQSTSIAIEAKKKECFRNCSKENINPKFDSVNGNIRGLNLSIMYDRVKLLAKIGNSFQRLTNFQKNSILDA